MLEWCTYIFVTDTVFDTVCLSIVLWKNSYKVTINLAFSRSSGAATAWCHANKPDSLAVKCPMCLLGKHIAAAHEAKLIDLQYRVAWRSVLCSSTTHVEVFLLWRKVNWAQVNIVIRLRRAVVLWTTFLIVSHPSFYHLSLKREVRGVWNEKYLSLADSRSH